MLTKLAFLFTLFAGVAQGQVADCAAGKSVFQINSQGFSPIPPVVGENATLWIDYTVPEGIEVDSGTAKYSISLNGIPFPPTVDDLCTQIACPQVPGTYNISSASVWQGGVSGKIISKIQWYDAAGTELLCSQTTIRTQLFREKSQNPLRTFLRHSHHRFEDTDTLDSSSSSSSGSGSGSSSSSSGSTSSSGSSSSSSSSGNSTSSSGSSTSGTSTSTSSSSSGSSSSSSTSSSGSSSTSGTSTGSSSSSSTSGSGSSSGSSSSSSSGSSSGSGSGSGSQLTYFRGQRS